MHVIDGQGKKRECVEIKCSYCGVIFVKPKRFYNETGNNFCCKEHSNLFRRRRVKVTCSYCGLEKEITKSKFDTTISKTGHFFCTRECQSKSQKIASGVDYSCNVKDGGVSYRTIALNHKDNKCSICGYDEYTCCLDVHHVDLNRNNNDIDNLLVLCVMCHRKLHSGIT